MTLDEIRALERVQANAWPPAVAESLDGWHLRFTWGISRRANCVWTGDAAGQLPLEEKLAAVEEFYARHAAPPRFQISPTADPGDLEHHLEQRGYALDAPTLVQTAPLSDVLERIPQRDARGARDLSLLERYDEAWYAAYRGVLESQEPEHPRREIMRRIQPPAAYARLQANARTIAVGSAVAESTWLGVFNVATAPAFRRQGAALLVMRALAHWGRDQGATRCYLQVTETNQPALRLYERLGFTTVYRYHYRVRGQ